jgi:predicted TIM-barrel fold metal-dependent hydrolase
MLIIDAQIHAYERVGPGEPARSGTGLGEASGQVVVDRMNAAGIDGAILVSPFWRYGYDDRYAMDVVARWPGRFALVSPVDAGRPDIGDFIAAWRKQPGTVGLRLLHTEIDIAAITSARYAPMFRALQALKVPLCVFAPGHLTSIGELARRYPDLSLVVDHLGLEVWDTFPPPPWRFDRIADVVSLASCPNISIKITGAPSLSASVYPYPDIWPVIGQILAAFGPERAMWGSDWTRTEPALSLADSIGVFLGTAWLSPDDRAQLMGGTAQRVFGWAPAP